MEFKQLGIASSACVMTITGMMLASCGAHSHGSSGSSGITAGRLYYAPAPAEVGEVLTISGSATNLSSSNPSATYVAIRDGSVTVATGVLTWPSDGGTAPLSFNDTVTVPGQHSYVVTLTTSEAGSSVMTLDLPVVYNLSPDITASAFSAAEVTLTMTLTDNGSGTVAFAVPYSITTQSLALPTVEYFDFTTQPLAPGASRSQSANFPLPLSAAVTYIITVDPLGDHGRNLAGTPAAAQIVIPFGGG